MANMKCGDPNNPDGPKIKANGTPCDLPVMAGTTRCYLHGGKSATSKLKAANTFALLRMPAIEALYKVLGALEHTIDQFREDTCAACGYPKGDADEKDALIRACLSATKTCQTILDRTEMGPRATLEISQTDGDFDLRLLSSDEKARMIGLLTELRGIKEAAKTRALKAPDTVQ